MVYSGKLGEPPPVRLPLRVAWVISGAVRTLYLCSFGLRRNVLDAPGDAEYNIFAAVSHEGTEMELQGLAALKYFPETLAMLVDNEVSCRLDPEASRANITTSLIRKSSSGRWGRPRSSWSIQRCLQRNYWYQYPKVGAGFALAMRHARTKGFSYDLAVRARTDVLFTARLDLVAMHLGYVSREATRRAGGEYVANEATGHCGELSQIKATPLCWTMQLSDHFIFGTSDIMMDLWCAPIPVAICPLCFVERGWAVRRMNITSMDDEYPCCEEVLRWNLVFRVGVRQAADEEQEPTLPRFSSFQSSDVPDLSDADVEWFQGDKMRPRSGCPVPTQDKKGPRHELCARAEKKVNHDPWQRLGTDHTRTAKATARMRNAARNQVLAPYRAPLWRIKPGLGFGVRSQKPEKKEKRGGKAENEGKPSKAAKQCMKSKGKSAICRGLDLNHGPQIDVVNSTFSGLGQCSRPTMDACAEQMAAREDPTAPAAPAGGGGKAKAQACPIMGKPCRRCHFWLTDEKSRACLPPNSVLPNVLSGKVRSHIRGERKLRKNGPGEAIV